MRGKEIEGERENRKEKRGVEREERRYESRSHMPLGCHFRT